MLRNSSAAYSRRLKSLIEQFRGEVGETLDEGEKLLVEHIAANPEAPSIFGPIEDDITAKRLLRLCIEAHAVSIHFHSMVEDAHRILEKAPIYEQAIAHFEQLLKETQEARLNPLTAHVLPDRDTLDATTFQKRIQASRDADLQGFGIDVDRDLLRLAAGSPKRFDVGFSSETTSKNRTAAQF
ncbi:MAG: hypothetical protein WBE48_14935 [Xanthobacteraceae bacterium]